jgi:uncharacterized membrane protein
MIPNLIFALAAFAITVIAYRGHRVATMVLGALVTIMATGAILLPNIASDGLYNDAALFLLLAAVVSTFLDLRRSLFSMK